MANTDDSWNKFGKSDPYFGVLSDERYRQSGMTGDLRSEFFGSGERHVETVFATIRAHVDPGFSPRSALDFGCGVGRLAIPLARRIPKVIAADVSDPMLSEAARNCVEQGVDNIAFVRSDDALRGVPKDLDFIHSFIVFQHIPTPRGLAILKHMLGLLTENGIGALHFTFARHASRLRIFLHRTCGSLPFANNFYNLARGRRFSHPNMEMNYYDMNTILDALYEQGCHDVHLRFSEHDGFIGAMAYFKKRSIAPL
jgi:SAM-dependent methyltransferase